MAVCKKMSKSCRPLALVQHLPLSSSVCLPALLWSRMRAVCRPVCRSSSLCSSSGLPLVSVLLWAQLLLPQ